jgi:aerobic-type carbon monoxide dehydrogenase small subunit (CoxS/CutS family)
MSYVESVNFDLAHHLEDKDEATAAQRRVDLMIPIIKGWMTEMGQEIASLNIQIHGGMGFIEETGAAPLYRDIRIAAIYEGTNGIQAADLVGRKVGSDAGETMMALIANMEDTHAALSQLESVGAKKAHEILGHAIGGLKYTTQAILEKLQANPQQAMQGSFAYLMQCGYCMGGWHMARAMLVAERMLAEDPNNAVAKAKIHTTRFYIEHILPRAHGYANSVVNSDGDILDMADEVF